MSTAAQNHPSTIRNTNRWSTKQLVTMALMCAIAILLSFVEFPIMPAASFLKLDIALVPAAVVGFAYGAGPGALVGIVSAVAHGAITGNWVGCLMNIIVACAYVIPSSLLYQRVGYRVQSPAALAGKESEGQAGESAELRRGRTFKGAMIGMVVATLCLIAGAIVANLVIDPIFYGMPFDTVVALVLPALLPFNIIKGVVVSLLTALVYKSISNLITPEKDQVKGR